jgi:hypothetical protein
MMLIPLRMHPGTYPEDQAGGLAGIRLDKMALVEFWSVPWGKR